LETTLTRWEKWRWNLRVLQFTLSVIFTQNSTGDAVRLRLMLREKTGEVAKLPIKKYSFGYQGRSERKSLSFCQILKSGRNSAAYICCSGPVSRRSGLTFQTESTEPYFLGFSQLLHFAATKRAFSRYGPFSLGVHSCIHT
jgi:hypothetical protein